MSYLKYHIINFLSLNLLRWCIKWFRIPFLLLYLCIKCIHILGCTNHSCQGNEPLHPGGAGLWTTKSAWNNPSGGTAWDYTSIGKGPSLTSSDSVSLFPLPPPSWEKKGSRAPESSPQTLLPFSLGMSLSYQRGGVHHTHTPGHPQRRT